MLAQPGGWHAVDEVLMAGNNLTTLQDRPELAALVSDFLIEHPAALDEAFALADEADADSAVGLANLVQFLGSGGDLDGVITTYAAHRVDAAFAGSGDPLYELTQAGEAIARVQMAADDLGEGVSIDVGGLVVDSAARRAGAAPHRRGGASRAAASSSATSTSPQPRTSREGPSRTARTSRSPSTSSPRVTRTERRSSRTSAW